MGDQADRLRELVSEVAAAYFSNTSVPPAQIAGVVDRIAASLEAIGQPSASAGAARLAPEPGPTPTQIRNSVRPDGITSFEDGKSYKTLRRHLSGLGMTPAQYRMKWGLPQDYPMVAPELSAVRSELARRTRLGRNIASSRKGARPSRGKRVSP